MTRRPLFVGMNPGKGPFLENRGTLKKLDEWVAIMGLERYAFVNVSPEPGKFDRGTIQWEILRGSVEGHERVISLGVVASQILDQIDVPHFRMPHPSGLNRLLNDKQYERDMIRLCKEYVGD